MPERRRDLTLHEASGMTKKELKELTYDQLLSVPDERLTLSDAQWLEARLRSMKSAWGRSPEIVPKRGKVTFGERSKSSGARPGKATIAGNPIDQKVLVRTYWEHGPWELRPKSRRRTAAP